MDGKSQALVDKYCTDFVLRTCKKDLMSLYDEQSSLMVV